MACPYFLPEQFLAAEIHTARDAREGEVRWVTAPLGALYLGSCHAQPDKPYTPSEEHQRRLCNRGYARCDCPRFPAGDTPDAVRFSVDDPGDGRLRIRYAYERAYLPAGCGVFLWDAAQNELNCENGDGAPDALVLRAQVRARAESYRRFAMRGA